MKSKVRTFIAVEVDEGVRSRASKLIKQLRQSGADVTWVAPENMHLTIKFLGDVDYRDVYHVCRAVEECVATVEPFTVEIRGVGAFPSLERPRVIWLGVDLGAAEMEALNERVESALSAIGFPREGRKFHAHLTLGRVRKSGRAVEHLVAMLREYQDVEFGPTTVDQLVIFSSELLPTGPVYEPMGHAELKG
ncbi:MAG: RNA 2',3'-cyclic phosphodiesterase [Thermogutta sp.]|jgi:2'-5' RNA ligase